MTRGQPEVRDVIGIADFVTYESSAEYPVEAVPEPFEDWRRALRLQVDLLGARVSVRRVDGYVVIVNPDGLRRRPGRPALSIVPPPVDDPSDAPGDNAVARAERVWRKT